VSGAALAAGCSNRAWPGTAVCQSGAARVLCITRCGETAPLSSSTAQMPGGAYRRRAKPARRS